MKKNLIILIAVISALAIILSACAPFIGDPAGTTAEPQTSDTTAGAADTTNGDTTNGDTTVGQDETTAKPDDTTEKPNDTTKEPDDTTKAPDDTTKAPDLSDQTPEEEGPYTVVESYLPVGVAAKVRTLFEQRLVSARAYAKQSTMPYAPADVTGISNGKLVSITIPVVQTGAKDTNGDFLFTISVIGNDEAGIKGNVKRSYAVKINAAKYGLSENDQSVCRFIKVDLRDYGIELSNKETLAFFGENDTVYPAYLFSNTAIAKVLAEEFSRATGYYNFGSSNETNGVSLSKNSLLYDFEFERTYDEKPESDTNMTDHEKKLAALKEAYGGKYFSILGDSISTYDGVCNNTLINATLADNVKLYPWGEVNDYSLTYWGRLVGDTGMTLCVDNAWSGSHVVGTEKWSYKDNMYYRATELDRDSGETPDVIFVFMSTNDLIHTSSFGNLYTILTANDGRTEEQKIEAWFAGVSSAAAASSNSIKPFSTWDAGYALALNAMKDKYDGAEIFCMTLMPNHHSGYTAQKLLQYNTCIKALGEYFGATVIELDKGEITYDNCNTYTVDGAGDAIHPNIKGYEYMEKCIIDAMYNKIASK